MRSSRRALAFTLRRHKFHAHRSLYFVRRTTREMRFAPHFANGRWSLPRVVAMAEVTMFLKEDTRGFASLDGERRREIASQGGVAAHRQGKAHQFNSEQAREAGRKGGLAVSKNRTHMARIGQKGGYVVSGDRATRVP